MCIRDSSSGIILSHMQSAIDSKLQNIRNLSHLLLLDDNFVKLSNSWDTDEFFSYSQVCYDELKSYQYVYNHNNILFYYPYRDYIVTHGVSNKSASIYSSMAYASHNSMIPVSYTHLFWHIRLPQRSLPRPRRSQQHRKTTSW